MRKITTREIEEATTFVTMDEVLKYIHCGRLTAERIAQAADAKIKIGKRALYNIKKMLEYMENTEEVKLEETNENAIEKCCENCTHCECSHYDYSEDKDTISEFYCECSGSEKNGLEVAEYCYHADGRLKYIAFRDDNACECYESRYEKEQEDEN